MNRYNIRYHIRIRENFYVVIPRNGHKIKTSVLFHQLKLNQFKFHPKIVRVNNQLCYISASKVLCRDGKPELQIIISFNEPDQANSLYKQRWQIESAFKALKSSGFNIEDTHLTEMERIEKLLSLVLIAFVWSYKIGLHLHTVKPIPVKKHGRKAYSFFKFGLNSLAKVININNLTEFENYCLFLSCT
jgi:transposase